MTLATDVGFERIFEVKSYLGLPEHRTLDRGNVYLSTTSRGSLGYVNDSQISGEGMGRKGAPSSLFLGSFWAGSGPSYVCNNDFTATGADPAEWQPRIQPTGNVQSIVNTDELQTFSSAFTDSGHASPRGINVSLTARSWADEQHEGRHPARLPDHQPWIELFRRLPCRAVRRLGCDRHLRQRRRHRSEHPFGLGRDAG